jgi:isoquinoline 1-oxidoreductase beta subunit
MNDYVVEAARIAKEAGRREAALDARRRHAPRLLPLRRLPQLHRRGGRERQGRRMAEPLRLVRRCGEVPDRHGNPPFAPARDGAGEFPARSSELRARRVGDAAVRADGFLRAPGSNGIAFATQSFIDELALAAGRIRCSSGSTCSRRRFPRSSRSRAGSSRRACAACWSSCARSPAGARDAAARHGMGVAFHFSHRGYFAEVVQATVSRAGVLKVDKVWVAADVGSQIINPSGAENQVQGSVLDGISEALAQEITIEKGRAVQSNFTDFPLIRMAQSPPVEMHWKITEYPPTGSASPRCRPSCRALQRDLRGHRQADSLAPAVEAGPEVGLTPHVPETRAVPSRTVQSWRPARTLGSIVCAERRRSGRSHGREMGFREHAPSLAGQASSSCVDRVLGR